MQLERRDWRGRTCPRFWTTRARTATGDAPGWRVEYGWGGAASTRFWISPKDDIFVVAFSQHMRCTPRLEEALKPIVYGAILGRGRGEVMGTHGWRYDL